MERRGGGRLFEAGRLLTFSAFWMGAYSRRTLIHVGRLQTILISCSSFFPCKGSWIPVLRKFVFVESGIWSLDLGIQLKESRIEWKSESKLH